MTAQDLGGAIILGTGMMLFVVGAKLKHSFARAGGLLLVLTGFFVVFVSLLNRTYVQPSRALSLAALVAAVAVFRLMAGFEPSPTESRKKPGD